MKELLIEKFEKPDKILPDGIMVWKNEDGEIHRENDKLAVIWANGRKSWYKNGQIHRNKDMPAIVWADGGKEWYKNGKFIKRISA